ERTAIVYQSLRIGSSFVPLATAAAVSSRDCVPATVSNDLIDVPTEKPAEVRGGVVIMIDTLRFDALATDRHSHPVAAHLAAFATEYEAFPNAYAVAPATASSLGGMLSGHYLGIDKSATLPQILSENGVVSLAVPTHGQVSKLVKEF